jgi:hypothetical protein
MAQRHRLTRDDVAAARHALSRVDARIRTEGEESVIAELWDAAVEEVAALPEIATIAERLAHLPAGETVGSSTGEDEAEAVHQAVVKLVQDAQRTEDESRASGDRPQSRG